MFAMKIHRSGGEVLLAACDKEFLGKEFREGKKRLKVSPNFYLGEEGDEEMLGNRIRNATIVNLVGSRCIQVAASVGMECQEVLLIDGVPHAQIVRL
jgi:hypothetical protein